MEAVLKSKAKPGAVTAKKTIIKVGPLLGRNKDVSLRLCEGVEFSMTHFNRPNKGFWNRQKINCFVNVVLQSLFACPAFFNMLTAIGNNQSVADRLDPDGLLKKLVHTAKFFDAKY